MREGLSGLVTEEGRTTFLTRTTRPVVCTCAIRLDRTNRLAKMTGADAKNMHVGRLTVRSQQVIKGTSNLQTGRTFRLTDSIETLLRL